mmetsp:Transcript_26823/g.75851  ORF Transcript_26823/g.75851 Transcript_26823/m.75851 type:complete len:207 (+) Transcript_26823:703-1323(+)
MCCELGGDDVTGAHQVAACQREQAAQALRQQIGRHVREARVREEADVVLRHREPGLLRGHAVRRPDAEAQAEAHGDAVQERDGGDLHLPQLVHRVVLLVHLLVRHLAARVGHEQRVQCFHVAARAEALLASAPQQDRLGGGVLPARRQRLAELADHFDVGCIQRLRAVDRDHGQSIGEVLQHDAIRHGTRGGWLTKAQLLETDFDA